MLYPYFPIGGSANEVQCAGEDAGADSTDHAERPTYVCLKVLSYVSIARHRRCPLSQVRHAHHIIEKKGNRGKGKHLLLEPWYQPQCHCAPPPPRRHSICFNQYQAACADSNFFQFFLLSPSPSPWPHHLPLPYQHRRPFLFNAGPLRHPRHRNLQSRPGRRMLHTRWTIRRKFQSP